MATNMPPSTREARGLAGILEDQLTESDSGQFEVGEQRERNHRYYALQPIGNEQRGKSHYISPDVLDSVESKKALFKETFLTGRQVVKFKRTQANPFEGDAKTAYAELTLNRNNKAQLLRDGWHDAFVAKRMVTLTEWWPDTKTVWVSVDGANQPQLLQILAMQQQNGEVVGIDQSRLQGANGLFYGEIGVEFDDSYVHIELCKPESYYRDPNATYPDDATWNAYEEDVSRGELVNRGYDPDQVYSLSLDYRFTSEEEDSSRKAHDRSWTRRRQNKRTKEQSSVTFYRTWTWLDMWDHDAEVAEEIGAPEGIVLYEIHWSQGTVLRWNDGSIAVKQADDQPFNEWTEYKVSHAEHGMADADITAHTQKVQSTLKRLIIDNQQMRNTTRYEVQVGALKNPRDLLDNRIGGIVWSKRPGAVVPLATPELSPLSMSVIGMLSADNDRRSGLSDLAKGMNTDAIRYQNAEGLIDKMTMAGNRRVMSSARDFAETFLVPLSKRIIKVGMENDKSSRMLETGGRTIPIAPSQWTDTENEMAVAKALTPEEGMKMAQTLLMMHSVQNQDPQMALLYGIPQKHALFDMVYDAIGVDDTTRLLERPDSPQFAQKMQQMSQQNQQQQQYQMQRDQQQIGLMQSADEREWEKLRTDQTDKMADNLLNEEKQEHDEAIDWAELSLERSQDRQVKVG